MASSEWKNSTRHSHLTTRQSYSPPWSPPPQRSDSASVAAETTNARCTPTSQASLVESKAVSMFMKAFSTWIAEIATMEASSFCFSPPKLTLVIQSGQSGWPPGSILETKFSYPENTTIRIKLPVSETSIRLSTPRMMSDSLEPGAWMMNSHNIMQNLSNSTA